MLFEHINVDFDPEDESSALKTWMKLNGGDTIEKWKEFEKSDYKKCLTFSGIFCFSYQKNFTFIFSHSQFSH
jgi:hypothetical protein